MPKAIHLLLSAALLVLGLMAAHAEGLNYGSLPELVAAAKAGVPEAESRLGSLYETGAGGLPQDSRLAVRWWKKAAAHGHAPSMAYLGAAYMYGNGVRQNSRRAVRQLRAALRAGEPLGASGLALAYQKGKGVRPDGVLACALYGIALDKSQGEERTALGQAQATLCQLLTPMQLEEAGALQHAWQPGRALPTRSKTWR